MVDGLLVVLLAVVGLTIAARRLALPESLLFLVGGIALSAIPGIPTVGYDADVVFLVFFPVLLFVAASETSWNDFRPNAAPVLRAALGIVITTTLAVGLAAKALVPDLSIAAAFLLGAILADPDFRLFFTLTRRIKVPRPMSVVLGGEGLFEGTAQLVIYLALSAAITTGAFTAIGLGVDLVLGPLIGVAVGAAAAWAIGRIDRLISDPALSIGLLLASPFIAYLPADAVGANRITAVVAAGLYIGTARDMTTTPTTRLSTPPVLEVLRLVINGFIYLPAGFALPTVFGRVEQSAGELVGWIVVLGSVVLLTRVAWSFGVEGLLFRRRRGRHDLVTWGELTLTSLAATRGAFALASALALPLVTGTGAPFPQRDLLIALSFGVVLFSVTVQGALLPVLLKRIALPYRYRNEREEALACEHTSAAALRRLDALEAQLRGVALDGLRLEYRSRHQRYGAAVDGTALAPEELHVRRELHVAEREALRELREANRISIGVFRAVQREIDLSETYFWPLRRF